MAPDSTYLPGGHFERATLDLADPKWEKPTPSSVPWDQARMRFSHGARVEVNCGAWEQGTVAGLHLCVAPESARTLHSARDALPAAYSVRLDSGRVVTVRRDTDSHIRAVINQHHQVPQLGQVDQLLGELSGIIGNIGSSQRQGLRPLYRR